LYVW